MNTRKNFETICEEGLLVLFWLLVCFLKSLPRSKVFSSNMGGGLVSFCFLEHNSQLPQPYRFYFGSKIQGILSMICSSKAGGEWQNKPACFMVARKQSSKVSPEKKGWGTRHRFKDHTSLVQPDISRVVLYNWYFLTQCSWHTKIKGHTQD